MVRNTNLNYMDSSFSNAGIQNFLSKPNDVNRLKSKLTLNLQENAGSSRRAKCNFSSPTVLSSPDVKNFNLSTPDIMKFLVGQSRTPTPGTPLFVKDLYSHTFETLNNYETDSSHNSSVQDDAQKNNLENSRNTDSSSSFISIDNQYNSLPAVDLMMLPDNVTVKDEPQTVPSLNSSPRLSPIDMESQEEIKLQRKRYRNRLAASKCRKRKLERIAKLEDKVRILKTENHDLVMMLSKLKGEVCTLKQKVMKHCENGCNILPYADL